MSKRKNTSNRISQEDLRKLQLLQLDMLTEFDRLCRQEGIHYVICGGTLLGAVRHKGYIPWDDDADIAMLRKEYEKFRRVAHKLNGDICFFQDHSTDAAYRWGDGKLRRTGTTLIRAGQEHIHCQTGVYVDVFPLDDIPKSLIGQMIHNAECFIFRKILYAEVGKCDSESAFIEKWIYVLLSKIPVDLVFAWLARMTKSSNNHTDNRVRVLLFAPWGSLYVHNKVRDRYGIPKKWITRTKRYEFEHASLLGMRDYDSFLTWLYGDWRLLPPEEKRKPKTLISEYDLGDEPRG